MDQERNEELRAATDRAVQRDPSGRIAVSAHSRIRRLVMIALLVLAAGALSYWFLRGTGRGSLAGRPVPEPDFDATSPSAGGVAPRPGDMLITIQSDKLENAHFKIEAAVAQSVASINTSALRTTGTVEPNAYKVAPVMPIAGGIVREVNCALGDKVERGQKLATIFSTELVDAQTAYLSMLAEIERHHQKYRRAEKLVEIGAASREEFEEVSAECKIDEAKLTAARQRLLLLGMRVKQVDDLSNVQQMERMGALISVESPASGAILSRSVNAGEVVTMGKELFRVADLSTVWVIGQIYEKDFAEARVGASVVITTLAYPGKRFPGRVSYIDPRVEPQTRTAQIRIGIKNPNDMLKLGMFVDVNVGEAPATGKQAMVSVPRSSVQMIGAKQVVFVVTDRAGIFAQREVSARPESDGHMMIYAGLNADERVVAEGSFLLRAESLKLDPSQLTASKTQSAAPAQATTRPSAQKAQTEQAEAKPSHSAQTSQEPTQSVTVTLSERGYQPESFKLRKGVPARVTFVRKVDATCGTEIVLAEYNIKRGLPLNQPVVVEFTPAKIGEFKFACGMDMLRGKIIVQ
ncbi:MAG TPA: efflux RND transporter periplasmic adaptor subunit [Blastocatellia bacterium]|jgi:RND family efflux transporter MFP subunit|nr:efflux RND transporter periplasmic adaptor subunit [Blastocatellia bacterium]